MYSRVKQPVVPNFSQKKVCTVLGCALLAAQYRDSMTLFILLTLLTFLIDVNVTLLVSKAVLVKFFLYSVWVELSIWYIPSYENQIVQPKF